MKIDKQKLIDLLVEKTDMEKDEVTNQLDQLIDRILDSAKRGKALEIKGFGLFFFDEEGALKFDPAEELSTEISFKYAGMKPVELKSERDTSVPELEDDEEGLDFIDEDFELDEPADVGEDEQEDFIDDPFAPAAAETPAEPTEVEEKPQKKAAKPVFKKPLRRRKDNTGAFIVLAIIVIAILIAGFFYYVSTRTQADEQSSIPSSQMEFNAEDFEAEDSEETVADQPVSENDTESEGESGRELAPDNTIPPEQESSNEVSEQENMTVSEPVQTMYGLMGMVAEEANNSYSIVLHSFLTEERALSAANRLRDDEYRVMITTRSVNEDTVWRVSVGQFETLEDALETTSQLPSPFDTQNFIQRIQIN